MFSNNGFRDITIINMPHHKYSIGSTIRSNPMIFYTLYHCTI